MMPLHQRRTATNPGNTAIMGIGGSIISSSSSSSTRSEYAADPDEQDDRNNRNRKFNSRNVGGDGRSMLQNFIGCNSQPPSQRRRSYCGVVIFELCVVGTVLYQSLYAASTIQQQQQQQRTRTTSTHHLVLLVLVTVLTTLPIVLTVLVGVGGIGTNTPNTAAGPDLPHQRYIPLLVVATILGNQFPHYISAGCVATGLVIFGLCSRPIHTIPPAPTKTTTTTTSTEDDKEEAEEECKENNKQQNKNTTADTKKKLKAAMSVVLLIGVLVLENFCIWVVSSTYTASQHKSTVPTPLQDNGQLALRYVLEEGLHLSKPTIVHLRNRINVEGILMAGLGVSLVTIELYGRSLQRNLWSLAMRAVFTLAAGRAIRTVCFLITVLPSQNPDCYFQHFPSPAPTLGSVAWFVVGMVPQVNGGCNDLIISGHATVTSTLACVITSVVHKPYFTVALWLFVIYDYCIEIYEGFHYSVDMVLGLILINLLFAVFQFVEEDDANNNKNGNKQQGTDETQDDPQQFVRFQDTTLHDIVWYTVPPFGAYLQLVGIIPKEYAMYQDIVYTIVVIYQIGKYGFQHYSQHVLFTLLYMALGLFL